MRSLNLQDRKILSVFGSSEWAGPYWRWCPQWPEGAVSVKQSPCLQQLQTQHRQALPSRTAEHCPMGCSSAQAPGASTALQALCQGGTGLRGSANCLPNQVFRESSSSLCAKCLGALSCFGWGGSRTAGLQQQTSPCWQSDPCILTCSAPCSSAMCRGNSQTLTAGGGDELWVPSSAQHPVPDTSCPATQALLCPSPKEGGLFPLPLFPHSIMFIQVIPPEAKVLFCNTRLPFHCCLRKGAVKCCLLCFKTQWGEISTMQQPEQHRKLFPRDTGLHQTSALCDESVSFQRYKTGFP